MYYIHLINPPLKPTDSHTPESAFKEHCDLDVQLPKCIDLGI